MPSMATTDVSISIVKIGSGASVTFNITKVYWANSKTLKIQIADA